MTEIAFAITQIVSKQRSVFIAPLKFQLSSTFVINLYSHRLASYDKVTTVLNAAMRQMPRA